MLNQRARIAQEMSWTVVRRFHCAGSAPAGGLSRVGQAVRFSRNQTMTDHSAISIGAKSPMRVSWGRRSRNVISP